MCWRGWRGLPLGETGTRPPSTRAASLGAQAAPPSCGGIADTARIDRAARFGWLCGAAASLAPRRRRHLRRTVPSLVSPGRQQVHTVGIHTTDSAVYGKCNTEHRLDRRATDAKLRCENEGGAVGFDRAKLRENGKMAKRWPAVAMPRRHIIYMCVWSSTHASGPRGARGAPARCKRHAARLTATRQSPGGTGPPASPAHSRKSGSVHH